MRERFTQVDDALIDRLFQPLADWMNHHMALGPNRAARTAIDLATLAWVCAQAGAAAKAFGSQDARSSVIGGAVLVAGLWAFTILRGVFHRKDSDAKARVRAEANPLRPAMQLHRAACLFWMIALLFKTLAAPADFGALALLAVGVFATAAVYIGACTNHPPKWREARESGWNPAFASGRF